MNAIEQTLAQQDSLPAAARILFKLLGALEFGSIQITTPQGSQHTFSGKKEGPHTHLGIKDWKAINRILSAGDIGIAECWRDGLINTTNMTHFLEFCIANEQAFEKVFYGNPVSALIYRIYHMLRPNTRKGAEKNIHAHYDLGNEFYKLWLDPTMSYSSGIFTDDTTTLEQSQFAKYDRICKELKLEAGMRVLEVGCGWGGFAEYAAKHYNVHVNGITISREQLTYATDRIQTADLRSQVQLSYCDYRDVKGQYDRIVSIEMFEAVGEKYWPGYFKMIHDRLVPNGRAIIQTIVIADAKFAQYRKTSDFIREYIFPGGMLSSPKHFVQLANTAGLKAKSPYYFGAAYARTLREWAHAINENESKIKTLGFDDQFLSIWRFYLHYCEAAFISGRTDVMQIELFKD